MGLETKYQLQATNEELTFLQEDAHKTSTSSEAVAVVENNHMLLTIINGTLNMSSF